MSASTTPAVSTATATSHATALVHLSFDVPKKTTSSKSRTAQYVSANTQSLTISVTPSGGNAFPEIYVACTTTCAASFQAPVGSDSISLKLTDGANGTGNQLSLSTTTVSVAADTANVFNLTANPVVSKVMLFVGTVPTATVSTNGGTPVDVPLTIRATDVDGNTIVGPGTYVDANGNPVTLTLSVANAQAGGLGTVTLSQSAFTMSPVSAITAHYDGNWLDHAVISATASSGMVDTSQAAATVATVPYVTEYPVPGNPHSIVSGPDGNLWITEFGANAIGKMTLAGTVTSYPCAPCFQPHFITAGPDGNLWFTEYGGGYADKITPNGVASRVLHLNGGGANGIRIRSGPDGNIWWSSTSLPLIGKLATNGTSLGVYTMAGSVGGIGFAADGSLWYAQQSSTIIGHISTGGSLLGTAMVSNLGFYPDGVVAGPDGNIWITNFGSDQLDKVTPTGSVTSIPLQSGAGPEDIIVGPDGNLWFTEFGTSTIGFIAPGSTTPTEFTSANGISANLQPWGIAVGADGNIWFTELAANKVAKFVL